MWDVKNIQSHAYLLRRERRIDQYYFFISNFYNIWKCALTVDEIYSLFMKLNPVIEADRQTIAVEISSLLDVDRKDVNWNITQTATSLKLNLDSELSDLPISFEFEFMPISSEDYFENLVLPLMVTVKNLKKQQEYLCDCIKKKDAEIKEYKLEGAVLSRQNVETVEFDKSILNDMFQSSLNDFDIFNTADLFDDSFKAYYELVLHHIRNKKEEMDVNSKIEVPRQLEIVTENKIEVQSLPSESSIDVQEPNDGQIAKKKLKLRKLKNL